MFQAFVTALRHVKLVVLRFRHGDQIFDFIVGRIVVNMMNIVPLRHRPVELLPYISVQTNAAGAAICANFLAEPIPLCILVKPLPVIFDISNNARLLLNLQASTTFQYYYNISERIFQVR